MNAIGWGHAVLLWLLDHIVIPTEVRRIAEHFGEAYAAYRHRVRRWI